MALVSAGNRLSQEAKARNQKKPGFLTSGWRILSFLTAAFA
ncbi:hypothetical protein [Kovacikia minuta]|nr:hypothetical protein [Kovacikia minuta]